MKPGAYSNAMKCGRILYGRSYLLSVLRRSAGFAAALGLTLPVSVAQTATHRCASAERSEREQHACAQILPSSPGSEWESPVPARLLLLSWPRGGRRRDWAGSYAIENGGQRRGWGQDRCGRAQWTSGEGHASLRLFRSADCRPDGLYPYPAEHCARGEGWT